ncbi:hypothetical protein RP726_07580 [Candidatus Methylospira mobilis]|uniref:hypothetical protein n=1 Tax=Candidatus Methylospira mobilis TaxID=1808979 RepID=UPI0028ED3AE1|nr:hypothetical protein [Candidatus Methylospira mobilis]WNV06259.1 hypothetical protein RP726_07580 [Candidatus Methylospira mobilis]
MAKLIMILAGLICAVLAGCKSQYANTVLHSHNNKVHESAPCLSNLGRLQAECTPAVNRQKMVVIRNVVLPVEE